MLEDLDKISSLISNFSSDEKYQEKRKASKPAEEKQYLLAFCFYEKGHYSEAAECFAKLATVNPYEKSYWFGLAASQQLAKNYQAALPAWCFAAILDQENAYPHFHAAECLISQGEIKEALLALEEAKKRSPEDELLEKITTLQAIWRRGDDVNAHAS